VVNFDSYIRVNFNPFVLKPRQTLGIQPLFLWFLSIVKIIHSSIGLSLWMSFWKIVSKRRSAIRTFRRTSATAVRWQTAPPPGGWLWQTACHLADIRGGPRMSDVSASTSDRHLDTGQSCSSKLLVRMFRMISISCKIVF
jgi:hypothetical protein